MSSLTDAISDDLAVDGRLSLGFGLGSPLHPIRKWPSAATRPILPPQKLSELLIEAADDYRTPPSERREHYANV